MVEEKEYRTIRYYKANKLINILKSEEAEKVIKDASVEDDDVAVLLRITNPLEIEKAVNVTKEGFAQIKKLVPF